MCVLDDLKKIHEIDRQDMLTRIDRMPEHLVEALTDLESLVPFESAGIENVLFVGVGTSAIAAEIALNWLTEHAKIPMVLIRDSWLPTFTDSRTVVLAVSYSGETQETLEALVNAFQRKCRILAISSGGKMREVSERLRIRHIEVRKGFEPRSAFPFLFVSSSLALAPWVRQIDLKREIQEASHTLRNLRSTIGWNVPCESNPAKQLALKMTETIPVIYAFRRNGGLARRTKNQLNENCKMPAMFNLLPEGCHNEFEAWRKGERDRAEFSFIFLTPDENDDERARIEEAKKILVEAGMTKVYEVCGVGSTRASRLLSVVYFADYVAFYLSVLRKIDPTPWERVQELKKRILQRTRFEERLNDEMKKIRS